MSFWGGRLSAAEAKKEYFLAPADLADLPHQSRGGFGCGNTKLYSESLLEVTALRKHGHAGLAAKREKREKREENKRKREAEAERAAEELLAPSSSSASKKQKARSDDVIDLTGDDASSPVAAAASVATAASAAAATTVDAAKIKSLRKEMRRALKKGVLTWDYMNSKRAANGAVGTVRLERIEQVEYCALIGRSADPELRTLVKAGAWYSLSVPFETAFGRGCDPLRGSGGRYGCNSDLGVDPAHGLTLKYQPKSKTLGVHVYVSHVDSHEGALDHLGW